MIWLTLHAPSSNPNPYILQCSPSYVIFTIQLRFHKLKLTFRWYILDKFLDMDKLLRENRIHKTKSLIWWIMLSFFSHGRITTYSLYSQQNSIFSQINLTPHSHWEPNSQDLYRWRWRNPKMRWQMLDIKRHINGQGNGTTLRSLLAWPS